MGTISERVQAKVDAGTARLDALAADIPVVPSDELRQRWREATRLAAAMRAERGETREVRRAHGLAANANQVRFAIGRELHRRGALSVTTGVVDDQPAA